MRIAERDGCSRRAGAPGSTDAVDVSFCHVREIKIHDMADAIDIYSACCDVGRNKDASPAVAKVRERSIAVILGLVAVYRRSIDSLRRQAADNQIGAAFGTREHQRAIDRCLAQ